VANTRPFLPQTQREWLHVARVLGILAAIGVVLYWSQEYIGRFAWVLAILALVAEPWLEARRASRSGRSSAHSLHLGRRCTVVDVGPGALRVRLDDTIWAARSLDAEPLEVGQQVYVQGGAGLVVDVGRRRPTSLVRGAAEQGDEADER